MRPAEDALARLDEYLSAAMSDSDAAAFEEELFAEAAAGRTEELGYLDGLFHQLRWFSGRGGLSSGFTAQMIAEWRKLPGVHHLDITANTEVSAWPAETKFVVYRLAVDLRGYEHVDVELVTPDGEHRKWFRDVSYDPADGALYGVCDAPLAASSFRWEPLVARVEATRGGKREVVAELRVTPR
jgi:hypothetical protein